MRLRSAVLLSRGFLLPLKEADVWDVETIPREEFASERFDYKPGEHVLFAGPTQRAGKTTLAFKLLEYTATPELPCFIAVSKPDDPVTAMEMRRLHYRLVQDWPAEPKVGEIFGGKPCGYVIWPKFGDMDKDTKHAADVTGKLLRDRYAQGVKGKHGILVCDDTVVKSKLLGLDREMTTHIAMAGAMKVGGWYFVQKPTDSGRAAIWSYGNSEHVFLSKDPDRRNRDRYDEIGGVDPHQVSALTQRLTPYQFLYLKRSGNFICVVDSK
jgi:hypothetical protein